MPKSVQKELIASMKRNTDNQFFIDLVKFIELRITLNTMMLVTCLDMDEVKRLQGRVLELQEFKRDLARKPIKTQESGGFDQ